MKMKKCLFEGASGMILFLFVLGAFLVLMPGTVSAQEDEYILEDTVVTATKTGETLLQKTPISIAVFDDEMIDNLSSFDLEDLLQFSAGTEFQRSGFGASIYIRGVGEGAAELAEDQNIGMYVDGVYMHQGRGAWADFMDVERVEILRGPQGVVWGRNATGGAINIVTKRPSDTLELTARVDIGNYGLRRVDGMISGPLVEDKINVRFAVADSQHDAMIDNAFNPAWGRRNENYTAYRGSIQILPTDNVEILVRGDYRKSDELYFNAFRPYIYDVNDPRSDAWLAVNYFGYSEDLFAPPDFNTISSDRDTFNSQEVWGGSMEINVDFANDITLRSLTAYREFEDLGRDDWDDTCMPLFHYDAGDGDIADWQLQEFTLTGITGRLQWVLGANYYQALQDRNEVTVNMWGPWLPPGMILDIFIEYRVDTEALAGFGNFTYSLTDKFSVTGGVRYSYESKTWALSKTMPFSPKMTHAATEDYNEWTPKLGIDYQATDNLLLYAFFAKGFKSGYASADNLFEGADPVIGPEYIDSYEAGIKSDWLDKRLRVNGAVFQNDYTDYQVGQLKEVPGVGPVRIDANAGGAKFQGAELEVVARPTQNLTLNGSAAYVTSEYEDFVMEDRFGEDRPADGNRVANTPEKSLSLGANYVVPIENHGFLTFGANLSWHGDVSASFWEDDAQMWIDSYTIVNARVRYETEDGHWSLEAYGKNIFDSEYIRGLDSDSPVDIFMNPGDAITMGVRATYKY